MSEKPVATATDAALERLVAKWREEAKRWRNWDARNIPPHRLLAKEKEDCADELEETLAAVRGERT